MNLEDLRNKVNSIMEENKPTVIYNTEEDKLIRETELQLTSSNLKQEFSVNLAELIDKSPESLLANGKFKLNQYQLIWGNTGEETFRLILKNIPFNNPKVLIKLPQNYKAEITPALHRFLEKIKNTISQNSLETED